MLNKKDRLVLSHLQDDFPLDPQPYAVIAQRLHMRPVSVFRMVRRFRADGVIRYIGAVLDTKKAGFRSSLVALAVPADRIRRVSVVINSHPEITHNYLRDDEYNMWFTITCRTDRRRRALVGRICQDAGISKWLDLPTVRMFKIDARFPLADQPRRNRPQGGCAGRRVSKKYAAPGRRALAQLGTELDLSGRPFAALARSIGCSENAVLERIRTALGKKLIRRFGAVLDHHKIGLTTNALVAWQIDRKDISRAARVLSQISPISHCYQRKTRPGWPYTMYTMIHAADRKACRKILQLILRSLGHTIKGMKVLYTVRELKKTRFHAGQPARTS
ncbi:MAG TPA: hypothetical protein PK107_03950 [Candidatus Omnitrophota bacterium]|nr:hypothetical protein [Candidatus Omnitrophota bacterium]